MPQSKEFLILNVNSDFTKRILLYNCVLKFRKITIVYVDVAVVKCIAFVFESNIILSQCFAFWKSKAIH